jgi:hypothetical protein
VKETAPVEAEQKEPRIFSIPPPPVASFERARANEKTASPADKDAQSRDES